MAQQSALLGLSARIRVEHTSDSEFGQIYVPAVNWLLLAGVVGAGDVLQVVDQPRGRLRHRRHRHHAGHDHRWCSRWRCAAGNGRGRSPIPVFAVFLVVDATLLSANMLKFHEGGWVPIVIAVVIFTHHVDLAEGPGRRSRQRESRHAADGAT